jgi:hypothetical protein
LDTAARLAAASADVYQNGHFRRALILGHKAVGVSLTAVIRPDPVTDDRIRALTDVATSEFQVLIDLAEVELAAYLKGMSGPGALHEKNHPTTIASP